MEEKRQNLSISLKKFVESVENFGNINNFLRDATPELKKELNKIAPELIQQISQIVLKTASSIHEDKILARIFHFLDAKTLVKTIPRVNKQWRRLGNNIEILEDNLDTCTTDVDRAVITYKILKLQIAKYKMEVNGLSREKNEKVFEDYLQKLIENLDTIDDMVVRFHQKGFDRIALKEHLKSLRMSSAVPNNLLKEISFSCNKFIDSLNLDLETTKSVFTTNNDIPKLHKKSSSKKDFFRKFIPLSNKKFNKTQKNVSTIWNVNDATTYFTGRKKDIKNIYDTLKTKHKVVITGMGGLGKTQVALAYANKYRKEYEDRIRWFDAGTEESLITSFREFTLALNINVAEKLNDEELRNTLLKELKSTPPILLIFDNVESYDYINEYVEISTSAKHKVLITSDRKNWGDWKTIELEIFSKDDAKKFILRVLNDLYKRKISEQDAMSLAKTLNFFPLALSPAVYMIGSTTMSVSNYIELHTNSSPDKDSLLKSETFPQENYKRSLYDVIKITRQKIRHDSQSAINILNICAYFHYASVPKALFKDLFDNETEFHKAISVLHNFSIIEIFTQYEDKDSIRIHKLIQDAICLQIEKDPSDNVSSWLSFAYILINNKLHFNYEYLDSSSFGVQLFIHARKIINYALNKNIDLEKSKSTLEQHDLYRYYQKNINRKTDSNTFDKEFRRLKENNRHFEIGDLCRRFNQFNKALEYYALALKNIRNQDEKIILIFRRGHVYRELGRYKEALTDFQHVIDNQKKSRSLNLALAHNYKGLILHALGKYDEAIENYKITENIFKNHYKKLIQELSPKSSPVSSESIPEYAWLNNEFYPPMARPINNRGLAESHLGHYKEAMDLYKTARYLYEKFLVFTSAKNELAMIKVNQGCVATYLEKYDEAEKFLMEALEDLDNGENSRAIFAYISLSRMYDYSGDATQAIAFLEKAIEFGNKQPYKDKLPAIANNLSNPSVDWQKLNNSNENINYYLNMKILSEKLYGHESIEIAYCLNNLGMAYQRTQENDQASDCFQKAITICNRLGLPDNHKNVLFIKKNMENCIQTKQYSPF